MNKINKIKQLLGLEVKLEQKALANGAVLEAESFEAGQSVFVVAEDEMIPVPVGEYEMEDGSVLVVSEEGVIGEIKSGEAEESMQEEEVVMEEEKTPKKVVESTVKESHFSDEQIGELADLVFAKLEERLETYTLKAGETEEEVVEEEVKEEVELKKVEAEIEPKVHTPEKQPVKRKFEHNANRHLTVKDRVLQKLSN